MNGFIPGSRASLSLDVIVVILLIGLPAMMASIFAVRKHRSYRFHKVMQLLLGAVLFVAIGILEWDIRLNDWRARAEPSPFYDSLVMPVLVVHLLFALPTLILWLWTLTGALRRFPKPIRPSGYSARHRKLGKAAFYGMVGTALTGFMFYCLAFIC